LQCDALHEIVERVDERLKRNRATAKGRFFAPAAAALVT